MTVGADTGIGRLQALCAGLCRDAEITVREAPGNGWFFTPATRTITVGADDLKTGGAEYCAGVMAHEVGHVFISRYHNFPIEFESVPILRDFLNGIEDPRANTWIKGRYPGAIDWQTRMRDRDVTQIQTLMPYSYLFSLECAREEYLDWRPANSVGPVPSAVMSELDRTRDARRRYAETLPPIDMIPLLSPHETRSKYERAVRPVYLHEKFEPFPGYWEQTVRISQHEALELAKSDLIPSLAAMLEIDLGRISHYILTEPRGENSARSALTSAAKTAIFLEAALRHKPESSVFEPAVGKTRVLALQILTGAAQCRSPKQGQCSKPVGGETSPKAPSATLGARNQMPVRRVELPAPKSVYEKTRLSLGSQIEHLSAMLEELFQPKRKLREKTGLPHGEKIDLKKLVAFDADPKLYRQLWRRKTIPDRRSFAIYLLVDLSSSMNQNGKIMAAFGGMVLLAEVLHRHHVDFAISGFQNELIPFHFFGEPFSPESRLKLEQMIPAVENGSNHDGPCLLEASVVLAARPATDRLLVVISDGEPSGPGNRENATRELKKTIEKIGSATTPVDLIGLGLGDGTDHVSEYYPKSSSCIRETDLAGEIAMVIKSALLGQG